MGALKKWRQQRWVRIGTDGSILGACGTSKAKKNPDRCLPLAKARRMTEGQRKSAVRRKRAKAQGVGGKPTNVKTFAVQGGLADYYKGVV